MKLIVWGQAEYECLLDVHKWLSSRTIDQGGDLFGQADRVLVQWEQFPQRNQRCA